jgi:hypothetical protein
MTVGLHECETRTERVAPGWACVHGVSELHAYVGLMMGHQQRQLAAAWSAGNWTRRNVPERADGQSNARARALPAVCLGALWQRRGADMHHYMHVHLSSVSHRATAWYAWLAKRNDDIGLCWLARWGEIEWVQHQPEFCSFGFSIVPPRRVTLGF